ncbi:MAG: LA_2272 family surface repeat-containing protein [Gemmatimonadaceae bacterium]
MRLFDAARFAATISLGAIPAAAPAQVINLTIHDYGLAIGDKPRVSGLRINYRDRYLKQVNGVNITLWQPYTPATGIVNGLGIGLPSTGALTVNGAIVGVLGAGVERSLNGIGVGGVGIGSGGDARGLLIGGVGVGSGGRITGVSLGGVGVGGAGSIRGIQIGGIGVGGGGELTGISIGGIGAGAAGKVSGLAVGGIGVGTGSDLEGIGIGGIGVGGAGDMTGLMIGGIGVGAGGTLEGVSLGGVGVGAVGLKGLAVSLIAAGAQNAHAIVLAGAYFKIETNGRFDGGALAAVNNIKGSQHGLTIGLFNYARDLHGAQVGLINISDNDGNRRVLPILSVR